MRVEANVMAEVLCEGYGEKKTPSGIPLLKMWQKRYMVLEAPAKLKYYKDDTKEELCGVIPFEHVDTCAWGTTRLSILMNHVNGKQRKFQWRFANKGLISVWVEAVTKAFELLDELEEEHGEEIFADLPDEAESDNEKYWKPEVRKELQLSVKLDDAPLPSSPSSSGPNTRPTAITLSEVPRSSLNPRNSLDPRNSRDSMHPRDSLHPRDSRDSLNPPSPGSSGSLRLSKKRGSVFLESDDKVERFSEEIQEMADGEQVISPKHAKNLSVSASLAAKSPSSKNTVENFEKIPEETAADADRDYDVVPQNSAAGEREEF